MASNGFTRSQLQSLIGENAPNLRQLKQKHQTGEEKEFKPPYPPLESITQPSLETSAAAFYLNRKDQTLREWACKGTGPIKPIRIHGRLAWPVTDLRKLLGA